MISEVRDGVRRVKHPWTIIGVLGFFIAPYAVGVVTRASPLPNLVGIGASPGVEMWLLGLYQLVTVSVLVSIAVVLGTLAAPTVRRVVGFVGGDGS